MDRRLCLSSDRDLSNTRDTIQTPSQDQQDSRTRPLRPAPLSYAPSTPSAPQPRSQLRALLHATGVPPYDTRVIHTNGTPSFLGDSNAPGYPTFIAAPSSHPFDDPAEESDSLTHLAQPLDSFRARLLQAYAPNTFPRLQQSHREHAGPWAAPPSPTLSDAAMDAIQFPPTLAGRLDPLSDSDSDDEANSTPQATPSALEIDDLPTRQITSADQDEDGHATCKICHYHIDVGIHVTYLRCGHWFCSDCLEPWLVQSNTCPTCRVQFDE